MIVMVCHSEAAGQRISYSVARRARFFAFTTFWLLMNKSVVRGVAWMERNPGGVSGNPGLHPGYGDFVVLARLDERAQRSRVLRINSATKNLITSRSWQEILRLRGTCPELAEGLRLRMTVFRKFTLTDYYRWTDYEYFAISSTMPPP